MIELNEAQRTAATSPDGPTLVLAGAGTGKTRVIVERIVWLIEERGVDPRNILALTFTNRAANEMRARVIARVMGRLGTERLASWVGTFHAFALYVLRREIERLGLRPSFTIFDEADQLSLMRRLLRDLPATHVKLTPRDVVSWISRLKQDLAEPDSAPCSNDAEETCRLLWNQYHDALRRASALDFDDLLVLLVRLLREHEDARDKYRRRYRHILVDEYQDTNRAQYEIARLLTDGHGNIFVVGDEDQSIYSWRGANIRNILDFERDFENARVVRLEQNYRSTAPILAAANELVKNNRRRLGKTLYTAHKHGEPVGFYVAGSAEEEAEWVVEEVKKLGDGAERSAVLYRANWQSRLVEEALRRRGMNYVVVGGVRFYSRKEIKDLLGYMRLLVNPADDESLRRIIAVPPRGIGGVTMERFEEYAKERNEPLLGVLRDTEHDQTLNPRMRNAALGFVHLIDDLAYQSKRMPVRDLVNLILDTTKYREYLRQSDEKDFRSRLETVDEFLSACAQFDGQQTGGVVEFLQDLALYSEADELAVREGAVTLLTCHSAKGLEFDTVFLIGLEAGLLPHVTAESEREVEEERRLCYVAMTRARKKLTLTAAQSRMMHGAREDRALSRFVHEIGGQLVRVRKEPREMPAGRPSLAKRPVGGQPPEAAADAVAEGAMKTGTPVHHPKFGRGYVMYTTGSGDKLRAKIRFNSGSVKMFMVSQSPLQIIEGKKK
ncbi:MAG TPA: UvrD-helicase domain-containing protein [Candidatus Bathyarchaeia archaeon]|nr:UvrD-helicase domain-containing protein [Candidatus Bathyarchaeia archaeon]